MLLNTKNFGQREIDENKIIKFEDGIPGFPNSKHFIMLIENDETISTIWWLQSIDDENLAFPVLNTFAVLDNYRPEIDDALLETLGEFSTEDLAVCNILVVPEDITQMTTNLKAPIIINVATKKGMQVIVNNSEYDVKHNIYAEIKKYNEKVGE